MFVRYYRIVAFVQPEIIGMSEYRHFHKLANWVLAPNIETRKPRDSPIQSEDCVTTQYKSLLVGSTWAVQFALSRFIMFAYVQRRMRRANKSLSCNRTNPIFCSAVNFNFTVQTNWEDYQNPLSPHQINRVVALLSSARSKLL